MPIVPIKTRTFTDPIDPELLLFIDARYIESYSGTLTASNLAIGNVENTGDGVIRGNVTYDTEEGGCFIMNGGFIDFTPSSITLEGTLGTGKGTNDLQISNRDNWSISAFVKPTRSQQAQFSPSNIFDTSNSTSSPFSVSYGTFGKSERFGFGGGFFDTTDSSRTYPINEWYHVVWTKQKISNQASVSHRYRLYINGVLQDDTGPRYNGGQPYKVCRIGFGFRGKIAQVKIFNKTLSASQVIDEFSSARVKLSSIGTKKVSNDVILYLAERGTSAGWGDNSMYSNGARLLGGAQFNSGLILSNTSMYASGTLQTDPGQNFTISSFFTCVGTSPISGCHAIFSINTDAQMTSPSTSIILRVRDDLRVDFVYYNTGVVYSIPNVFKKNVLTHLAVTVSQSGGNRIIKLFVNGVLVENGSPLPTPASISLNFDFSTRNYKIGRWRDSGPFVHQFNGKIHNVVVYNRTLSDTEVKELHNRMPSSYKSHESSSNQTPSYARILYVDGAEPTSYYAPTGGLTFKDISGYKRNGTLSRGSRLQSGSPVIGTYPSFETFNGGYFSFNGFKTTNPANTDQTGSSYISFPTTFLPAGNLPSTIIAWVRVNPSSVPGYRYIFSYGTYNVNGQNRYIGIKYPDSFSIGGAGNTNTVLDEPGMVTGEWFQIAFVFLNPEMKMFINGTIRKIKSQTLNTQITSANIGRSNTTVGTDSPPEDGYFYGDIAQLIVYNRALNENEIYRHYQNTRQRFDAPFIEMPIIPAEIVEPVVTTLLPLSPSSISFGAGAQLNFDGNTAINTLGVMWRVKPTTLPEPDFLWNINTAWAPVTDGVYLNITGLNSNTTYQVRAFAYNGTLYGYGNIEEETTLGQSVLTVQAVTASFTGLYADAIGRVSDLGSGNTSYVERGFVWSTSNINISTADNITTNRVTDTKISAPLWSNINEQWTFRLPAIGTNLVSGTTYFVRAFSKTSPTSTRVYSNEQLVFTTYTFATLTVTIPTDPTLIANTTAQITGNISTVGSGGPITLKGIVWAESTVSQDPFIDTNNYTQNGSGTAQFTGTLNNLQAGKTYYVKAYAITSAGVAYSTAKSFVTDNVPEITTVDMSYNNLYRLAFAGGPTIKQSATASGSITNTNGDTITEVGVVWSTSNTNIDINTNQGKVSLTTGITNNFNVKIPDLTTNTLYYFRAYAVNSVGVGYGTIKQFKTLYTPTVTRVSSPGEINSPGSVTLRAFVDKTAFGNSDFYNEPLTVGFLYGLSTDPSLTRVVVDTNYLLSDAQSTVPANYFTTNLTLPTGFSYIIRAFSQFKGYPFDVVGESIFSWNLGIYNIPTLTTKLATSTSFSGAQSGGDISSDGGDVVISRGVVWTTDVFDDPVYPVDSNINLPGSGIDYNAAIAGLQEGTTYYYRAFARNNTGVGYGNKRSLTTTSRVETATNNASGILFNSATLNGTTVVTGGLGGYTDIDEVGFYWSTVQSNLPSQPAVGASVITTATKVVAGENVGLGSFNYTLSPLAAGTTYYYVAYTKNPAGTYIGQPVFFTTTEVALPTVVIGSSGNITTTSVDITNSSISNTGGGSISAKGVVWSTSQNPTIALTTKTSNGSGSNSFNSAITGLVTNTTYYIKAYATNEAGTNYSSQISITTDNGIPPTIIMSTLIDVRVESSSIIKFTPLLSSISGSPTEVGFIWSTNATPTLSNSNSVPKIVTNNNDVVLTFNYPISPTTGINVSTQYYARAYATKGSTTVYSSIQPLYTFLSQITSFGPSGGGKSRILLSYSVQSGGNITSMDVLISDEPITIIGMSVQPTEIVTNITSTLNFNTGVAYVAGKYIRLRATLNGGLTNQTYVYSNEIITIGL